MVHVRGSRGLEITMQLTVSRCRTSPAPFRRQEERCATRGVSARIVWTRFWDSGGLFKHPCLTGFEG